MMNSVLENFTILQVTHLTYYYEGLSLLLVFIGCHGTGRTRNLDPPFFLDRENRINLPKTIKDMFQQGEYYLRHRHF